MKIRRPFGIVLLAAAAAVLVGCNGDEEAVQRAPAAAEDTRPVPSETAPPTTPDDLPTGGSAPQETDEVADGPREPAAAPDRTPGEDAARAPERGGDPSVSEILARVENRYAPVRSIQAEFLQRVDVRLLGDEVTSRGTLYQRRPNLFAMRFEDPEGDVIVADGRYLWMYHPSVDDRQVMRASLGDDAEEVDFHREFLQGAEERYEVRREGSASVAGRTADVLRLDPRAASQYRQVRIWVDRGDSFVRRFEITEENGNVRTVELRNIRTDVSVPDRVFRFDPPEGARVFSQ